MNNPIKNITPLGFQWQTADPFLFCVHHEDFYPEGNDQMGINPENLQGRYLGNDFQLKDGFRMYHGNPVPGFPQHPHRGFETITIVRDGFVDHSDSHGGLGRYGNGDVQWMTAGKGLNHAEMFPLVHSDKPNRTELFQIWLNLPKKNKFVKPDYKMLWAEDIPKIEVRNEAGKKAIVELIAGSFDNKKAVAPPENSWAADSNNQLSILNILMESGSEISIPRVNLEEFNRNLYFYRGESITINNEKINNNCRVELNSNDDIVIKNGEKPTSILLLQSKPINEPVAQQGPFVMNTVGEIKEAILEYQQTEFGGWPFDRSDYVHAKEKGRFAKYSDGSSEEK
ncbi:pirin family protein [Candidatus Kapabacteria bacterium]|nr:pirin family protein [Candidatus Kapabacteria bacterium]